MNRFGRLALLLTLVCIAFMLTACSTKDSDEDFGNEYDTDYLMTEYADQLLRDGAETVVGSVEINGTEGDYTVFVAAKKIVKNENYEKGYYIADKNITDTYPLDSDLGILVNVDGKVQACTTEEFIENYSGDPDALYTVFLMNGVVELIQPLDLEAAADSD